jgi:CubicO group peptidase (beta-lactamase class C family)
MDEMVAQWPVSNAAAGWRDRVGTFWTHGDPTRPFLLASVTKPLFALAVLVAIEEGTMALDQPLGPDGSTVAHLLSHSSGLAPEADSTSPAAVVEGPIFAPVGSRRIYSNHGFELLGQALATASGMTANQYFHEAVVLPLGLADTRLEGSPAHGAISTLTDLLVVVGELLAPTLISAQTLERATTPHLPDLPGVLPGFGRQNPNPWGLGFEIKGTKTPHWTAEVNSVRTFGHFGRAGTFLWVDPDVGLGAVGLSDREFGPWAAQAWPEFSQAVLGCAR